MARQRDYPAEYRRRMERGSARGLSRSQARGHAKAKERSAESIRGKADPKLEAAIRDMNRGKSMTAAARSHHVSAERLRRTLIEQHIANRQDRRWVMDDDRPRRISVITHGKIEQPILAGYAEARLAGAHLEAAGRFVRTNDIDYLTPFEGMAVRTIRGRKIPLETDPNALHRVASMNAQIFLEIYDIVSPD